MRRLALVTVLAFAACIAHQALFGSWIVDDAAISYSYARSLAQGHGLVAQPGVAPVEGFTNLLWVLVLSLPMALGVFDPVITPKLLGGAAVLAAFWLTARLVTADGRRPALLAGAALMLTAAVPGFAIWSTSGLENALYAALTAWLATMCARDRVRPAAAGLMVFLVFCTRPDGVLYAWIPAFMLGLRPETPRRAAAVYGAAFVAPFALQTAWRAAYFADVMPNTLYAKKGEGSIIFEWLTRELPLPLAALSTAAFGALGVALIVAGAFAAGRALQRLVAAEQVRRQTPLLFLLTAIVVYHALRKDWMGEFRFATPAFLFGPAALLALAWDLGGRRARLAATVVAVGAAAVVITYTVPHTRAFRAQPTLAYQEVEEFAGRIAAEVESLGPRPTVMTPDIGGALWHDRFEVVDYLGLIDRTIGRRREFNHAVMRDYIIGVRRPDAVFLHSHFLRKSGLHTDPAFRAAYDAVWQEGTAEGGLPSYALYLRRD